MSSAKDNIKDQDVVNWADSGHEEEVALARSIYGEGPFMAFLPSCETFSGKPIWYFQLKRENGSSVTNEKGQNVIFEEYLFKKVIGL